MVPIWKGYELLVVPNCCFLFQISVQCFLPRIYTNDVWFVKEEKNTFTTLCMSCRKKTFIWITRNSWVKNSDVDEALKNFIVFQLQFDH